MNAIIYLLQVSACMALFYGFYHILLSRLTFFTVNRFYLVGALVFSFIIPLLTIPISQQYTAAPVVQQVMQMRSVPTIPAYTVTTITAPIQTTSPIKWMQLLNWSYLAAVTGLSIHLLITLFNFFIKLKRRKLSSLGSIHILRGDKKLPNGSFLNYIFLNDNELSAEEMEQVVAHEMLHVKLYHSADRILMKLVQIILWFNPLVYFYARSMEENHEFEVDREVAQSTDKTKYADLLLHLSVANQGMLYHSFSKVPLKKRIIMLFNKPSAKVKRAVYILILPVIAISCLAFGKIKKDYIKIDLVRSGKQILKAIKTGQDNLETQLNKPIQLPAAISTTDSTISINAISKPVGSITASANDTTIRYSRFGNFSDNAKVTINGKPHPASILYEMGNKNVSSMSFHKNDQGEVFDINTDNGQIIYMTAHEKDNLRKEKTTPIDQFYTRLHLTEDNGERYDYVVIRIYNAVSRDNQGKISYIPGNRHTDVKVGPDDKILFKINGQLYDEDELKTIPQEVLRSLNRVGSATYRPETLYQNKYKVVFNISSPDYEDTRNNNANETAGGGRAFGGGGFRNFVFAGYPTDTTEYNAQAFKTGLSPDAKLFELVSRLPNFTNKENAVYLNSKVINALYVDGKEYDGWVIKGLNSLPAGNAHRIILTSADPQNKNPLIMYIINKPNN